MEDRGHRKRGQPWEDLLVDEGAFMGRSNGRSGAQKEEVSMGRLFAEIRGTLMGISIANRRHRKKG